MFRSYLLTLLLYCNRAASGVDWKQAPLSRQTGAHHVEVHKNGSPTRLANFVTNVEPSVPLRDPTLGVYIPNEVEIRGSSLSAVIHGIYALRPAGESPDSGSRPVYRRISEPNLYISWVSLPRPKWVISEEIARVGYSQIPYAELLSAALVPAFSRGWYVRPEQPNGSFVQNPLDMPKLKGELAFSDFAANPDVTDVPKSPSLDPASPQGNPKYIQAEHLQQQSELQSEQQSEHSIQPSSYLQLNKTRVSLKYDAATICDEARPGTFSNLKSTVNPGCSETVTTAKLKMRCYPPKARRTGATEPVLDFYMEGGEIFKKTLFSYGGYFLKRPYYVLRSPLNPTPQFGISEVYANVRYFWAEGLIKNKEAPIWYISRQLGNKNINQVFTVWQARDEKIRTQIPANYPAQDGIELEPSDWTLVDDYVVVKNQGNDFGVSALNYVRANIQIRGYPLYSNSFVVLQNGPPELSGEYYLVDEYLGYPFYRQDREKGAKGFALYRGFVMAADKDTWVIGAALGSTEGIHAYAEDPHARIPSHIKTRWIIWENAEWKVSAMVAYEGQQPNSDLQPQPSSQ